ncbi:hypothetical protein OC846_001678 [Tilletia horrida]|uniref:GAR domain-containing protein n=1 Tax=Tilletia horrida TaxID=155126 RepID=A0AAN6JTB3_9BASI|nr:hypothetical protein OC846_001678 [Tilletia horrida]
MLAQPAQPLSNPQQDHPESHGSLSAEEAARTNDSQATLLDPAKEPMIHQHPDQASKHTVPYPSNTSTAPKSTNIEITSENERHAYEEQDRDRDEDQDGDVTITADDGEGAADASAEADASKQSLSTDELIELRQFSEKKEQIDEQYTLLQSRPMPELFPLLQPMDSSEAVVDATFAELPVRKAELQGWLSEHERIQNDAVAFNVADMNRLRTVAKAASERHMSPQDTDLIELTVGTLVALDKLLLLLNERRRKLDLLAARLEWEERRASCWKAFHPLMEDIGLFVQKRARWTSAAYNRVAEKSSSMDRMESPSASLMSHATAMTEESRIGPISLSTSSAATTLPTSEAQALLLEALDAELNALSIRLRELVAELVPSAGEALDSLIDQGQVPDEYLEEQEKLEDLGLGMTARGLFITSLAAQWRKANELYLATRSLHTKAKELLAEAESIRTQVPTQALYDRMLQASTALNARLEDLAGPTARRFVYNPAQSAHSLVFSSANHLPTPLHDAWPDQVGQNALIATQLDRDLAAAAKRTRQAAMTVESYNRGLGAAQRAEVIQQKLATIGESLDRIKTLAVEGFNPGPGTSASGMADPGTRPDLSTMDCLAPSRHSIYARRLPEEDAKARKLYAEGAALVEELERNLATCARHSLTNPTIKQRGEAAIQAYRTAQASADEALTHGSHLIALLQQARATHSGLSRLQVDVSELRVDIDASARNPPVNSSRGGESWESAFVPRPTAAEAKDRLKSCTKSLEDVDAQIVALASLPRASAASEVRDQFKANRDRLSEQLSQLRQLVAWYDSFCNQEASVRALGRSIGAVRKQATAIRDKAAGKRAAPDMAALLVEQTAFKEAVQHFEQKAATTTVFTGDAPNLEDVDEILVTPSRRQGHQSRRSSVDLSKRLPLVAHDQKVRQCVNDWCTEAKTLQEQVASAISSAEQELARQKIAAEASGQRNSRFDAAVTAALEAVQDLSIELTEREAGFEEILNTSGSFPDLRNYRDETRDALSTKEKAVGERLDSLRVCQREMISSLYSTGKPVTSDGDSSSTAAAVKVRNAASSTIKAVRKTLSSFDDQLSQSTNGRRSISAQFTGPKSESKDGLAENSIGDISQDVFGPRKTTPMASSPAPKVQLDFDELIRSLRNDALDEQTVEDGVAQSEALLPLPTAEQDSGVTHWWIQTRASLEEGLRFSRSSPGGRRLAAAVDLRAKSVTRHGQLTAFKMKASEQEHAVSALLSTLDFNGGRSITSSMENLSALSSRATSPYLATLEQIETLQQRLLKCLEELRSAAVPVLGDVRVSQRLAQLTRATEDVLADAKDFGRSTDVSVMTPDLEDADDAGSVVSTSSSVVSSLHSVESKGQLATVDEADLEPMSSPRLHTPLQKVTQALPKRRSHLRQPSTVTANGTMPSTPTATNERRSVSEHVPASTSKIQPRLRRLQSNIAPPQTPSSRSSSRLLSPSPGPAGLSKLPVRTPSTEQRRRPPADIGMAPTVTQTTAASSARYRANAKSKLDVAVGKIVNRMSVPVKIARANSASAVKKQDSWKDESGRYWIGDPEPKLCFCRILRSRTVMVRVGGGWQELSSYITQHYSHLAAAANLTLPPAPGTGRSPVAAKPIRLSGTDLPWISSATMTRSSTLEVPPVFLTPADETKRHRFPDRFDGDDSRGSITFRGRRSESAQLDEKDGFWEARMIYRQPKFGMSPDPDRSRSILS